MSNRSIIIMVLVLISAEATHVEEAKKDAPAAAPAAPAAAPAADAKKQSY